ncbi:hypothetical protein LTR22_010270 [Elasticomyces elasticus]|nr:hypothetical protein LTR22_010270 [Elasticomyces elasticus]KAK4922119.1 hypothetical protein LTR49_010530 [Elasticomyces elasticus]
MNYSAHCLTGMEVLIVGAGTTGLLLAQGLKQAGIAFTICERDSIDRYKNRPREWGMTLHWGSEAVAKVLPLELRNRIHEACCDSYYTPSEDDAELVHYAGHTGEPFLRTPAANAKSVSRRKMRTLFSEGIDVKYSKHLIRIEKHDTRVTAHFADGESIAADLVVGCDGAKSAVRQMLVGEEAAKVSYMDINMINFPARFDAETAKLIRAKHPIFFNSVHRDGFFFWVRIQDVPDPSDAASWAFQILFTWRDSPNRDELDTQEKWTAWLKSKAAIYAEPWRTILDNLPADSEFSIDRVTLWRPVDWSGSPLSGKVTLAGDAAHNMPPFRGQGLNNAMEDAAQLVERITGAPASANGWRGAVSAYDEEMRARGLRDVNIGEQSAIMFHDFNKMLESPMAKLGLRKSNQNDVKLDKS